jgi:hypothetical protein
VDLGAPVQALAWSPAGTGLAATLEAEVVVLDPLTGAERRRIPVERAADVVFAGEDRLIVASRGVTVVDLDQGPVLEWSPTAGYGADRLALAPDGRHVAVLQAWEDADRLWLVSLP